MLRLDNKELMISIKRAMGCAGIYDEALMFPGAVISGSESVSLMLGGGAVSIHNILRADYDAARAAASPRHMSHRRIVSFSQEYGRRSFSVSPEMVTRVHNKNNVGGLAL